MARHLAAPLVACSIAFGVHTAVAGDISQARIQELMASRDGQETTLRTLRSRDRDVLVDLGQALSRNYGDLLAGSEMVFTRLVEDGNIVYRMDFVGLANADRGRALCEILEMDACVTFSGGGRMRLLRTSENGGVSAIGALEDPRPFAFEDEVGERSFNPEARKVEERVRRKLDPLGVHPVPRPELASAENGGNGDVESSAVSGIEAPDAADIPRPVPRPVLRSAPRPVPRPVLRSEIASGRADASGGLERSARPRPRPIEVDGGEAISVIEYVETADGGAAAVAVEDEVRMIEDGRAPSLETPGDMKPSPMRAPVAGGDPVQPRVLLKMPSGEDADAGDAGEFAGPGDRVAPLLLEDPIPDADPEEGGGVGEDAAGSSVPGDSQRDTRGEEGVGGSDDGASASPTTGEEESSAADPGAGPAPLLLRPSMRIVRAASAAAAEEDEEDKEGEEDPGPDTGRGPLLLEPSMRVAPPAAGPARGANSGLVQPDGEARLDVLSRPGAIRIADAGGGFLSHSVLGTRGDNLGHGRPAAKAAATTIPGIGTVGFDRFDGSIPALSRAGPVRFSAAAAPAGRRADPVMVCAAGEMSGEMSGADREETGDDAAGADVAPTIAAAPKAGEEPLVEVSVSSSDPAIFPVPRDRVVAALSAPEPITVSPAPRAFALAALAERRSEEENAFASIQASPLPRRTAMAALAVAAKPQPRRTAMAALAVAAKPQPRPVRLASIETPRERAADPAGGALGASPDARDAVAGEPGRTALDAAVSRMSSPVPGVPVAGMGVSPRSGLEQMERLVPRIRHNEIRIMREDEVRISHLGRVTFDDQFARPASADFRGGRDAGRLQKLPDPRPELSGLAERRQAGHEADLDRARLALTVGDALGGPTDVAQVPGVGATGTMPSVDGLSAAETPARGAESLDARDRLLGPAPEAKGGTDTPSGPEAMPPASAPSPDTAPDPEAGAETLLGGSPGSAESSGGSFVKLPAGDGAPAPRPALRETPPAADSGQRGGAERMPRPAPVIGTNGAGQDPESAAGTAGAGIAEEAAARDRRSREQALRVLEDIRRTGTPMRRAAREAGSEAGSQAGSARTTGRRGGAADAAEEAPRRSVPGRVEIAPGPGESLDRVARAPEAAAEPVPQARAPASSLMDRAAPEDRPGSGFSPADLRLELSYVASRDVVMERVAELKKFFPPVMLEKGRFFGASVPYTADRYIVGIEARGLSSRDDLIWYLDQMGMPWAQRARADQGG